MSAPNGAHTYAIINSIRTYCGAASLILYQHRMWKGRRWRRRRAESLPVVTGNYGLIFGKANGKTFDFWLAHVKHRENRILHCWPMTRYPIVCCKCVTLTWSSEKHTHTRLYWWTKRMKRAIPTLGQVATSQSPGFGVKRCEWNIILWYHHTQGTNRKKKWKRRKKRLTYFLECHHTNVTWPSLKIFNIFKILRVNGR